MGIHRNIAKIEQEELNEFRFTLITEIESNQRKVEVDKAFSKCKVVGSSVQLFLKFQTVSLVSGNS